MKLFISFLVVLTFVPCLPAQERSRKDGYWGLHFDLHPQPTDTSLGADISEENIADLLDRVKPDFVQYDCKGHVGYLGYPDSEVGPSAPGIVNDSLRMWRKLTAERDMALAIHFSGVWDSQAVQENPEWAALDAQKNSNGNATSVFGPYVDERMIPQLKEVITRYDLDAAWVDGEGWATMLDYSPMALAAWEEQTGFTKAPTSREDEHWYEWKMFQRRAYEAYLRHWVDELHEAFPDVQVTSNWMYTTHSPKPVDVPIDFLSGDYSHGQSLYRVRPDARLLSNNNMPWDLMAWGFHRGPGLHWTIKPAQQLMQEACVVIMQGGGFQVYHQPTRSGYVVEPIIRQLEAVGDFVRRRESFSHGTTTVPQVGVFLSAETYFDQSDRVFAPWGGEYNNLNAVLYALLRNQYSVDVLADHQLEEVIEEYPVIVIPTLSRLNAEMKDRFVKYVEEGGSLVLLGTDTVSFFDDDLLGITRLQEQPQTVSTEVAVGESIVNMNGEWLAVSTDGSRSLLSRYATRDTRKESSIAATIHSYGKGKVLAFYGPYASHMHQGHVPQLVDAMDVLMQEAFDPLVKIDSPPWIECALRKDDDGRLVIHLLNTAGAPTSDQYGYVDDIPPVGPITIYARMDKEPSDVQWLPDGGRYFYSWGNGILTVELPGVHIHGAVVIEP